MSQGPIHSQRKRLNDYERFLKILSLITALLGLIVAIGAYAPATQFIMNFLFSIPPIIAVLILFLLGIGFYWLQSRFRMIYGGAEFAFGLATAVNVFLPLQFDYSQLKPIALLQILGGIYVMVRDWITLGLA